jgi:hypothetical protein
MALYAFQLLRVLDSIFSPVFLGFANFSDLGCWVVQHEYLIGLPNVGRTLLVISLA